MPFGATQDVPILHGTITAFPENKKIKIFLIFFSKS